MRHALTGVLVETQLRASYFFAPSHALTGVLVETGFHLKSVGR